MATLRTINGRPAQAGDRPFSLGGAHAHIAASPVDLTQPLVDADHVARLLCVKRKRIYDLARRPHDPLPLVRIGRAVRFALP